MKPLAWAALLGLAVVLVFLLSIRLGSGMDLTTGEVFAALRGEGDINVRRIVVDLRAPRAVMAILVGGGLSLAGAVFQALLRNPLAEPYILGISGGAATGAVLALAMGLTASYSWALPAAAFAGALLAIVLVLRVAAAADNQVDVRVLLLAGVVIGAFFAACISFVLSISDARTVRSAVLWMMGSLAGSDWPTVVMVTLYTLPAGIALVGLARPLNLLAIGEETAGYLGANVERVKRFAYVLASLLTAAGVAATGVIGFVGLIVPHGVRLLVGADYRVLLPLSFLAGAVFLTLADVVARIVMSPAEVPIGVITAFVGVPLFLLLLRRSMAAPTWCGDRIVNADRFHRAGRSERIRGPSGDRTDGSLSACARARTRFGNHARAAGHLLRRFGPEWLREVDVTSGAPWHGAARCRSGSRVRSTGLGLGSAGAGAGSRCRNAVGVGRLPHYREGARGDGALPPLGRPPIRDTHRPGGHIGGYADVRHREPGAAIPVHPVRR